MKWDNQTRPKTPKKSSTATTGPHHRFYQRRSWEKNFSMVESRQKMNRAHSSASQEARLHQLFQNHWYGVNHRQHNQMTNALPQPTQESGHGNFPKSYATVRTPARVVWLQQTLLQLPKALALRTRFLEAGMQVQLRPLELEDVACIEGELIVLEGFGLFEQEMLKVLVKIRCFSKAPLIILTDNYTLDWSIRALHSGADAIFTVNMPDDVIIARSKALLRRWISI